MCIRDRIYPDMPARFVLSYFLKSFFPILRPVPEICQALFLPAPVSGLQNSEDKSTVFLLFPVRPEVPSKANDPEPLPQALPADVYKRQGVICNTGT